MKAARYYGPEDVRIEDVPQPGPPGPGEVLLQVKLAALCGTDATQYLTPTMVPVHAPHPVSGQQAPLVLGHEMVGTILEVGQGIGEARVGQLVVPGAAWWCDGCEQCQDRRSNICQHAFLYGIHADGGLAELVRVPAKMCVPVPDECHLEAAVLAQPLAVALHALDRAELQDFRESVALFGVGSIGTLFLAVWEAKAPCEGEDFEAAPQSLVVVDLDAKRLATAAALGATLRVNASLEDPVAAILRMTNGQGVDLAIEATGNPTSIVQALACVKRGGRMLQVGIPSGPVPFPLGEMVLAEKTLDTTNGQICERDLLHALDLLSYTNLADLINVRLIALDDLVEQGLQPLAEHTASAKVLVRIP
jgi:(R,R)-butanediol dehydrogenase/meso-butanediol dehydrogenase/diacetyl reductase